jgi:hypothetical protein
VLDQQGFLWRYLDPPLLRRRLDGQSCNRVLPDPIASKIPCMIRVVCFGCLSIEIPALGLLPQKGYLVVSRQVFPTGNNFFKRGGKGKVDDTPRSLLLFRGLDGTYKICSLTRLIRVFSKKERLQCWTFQPAGIKVIEDNLIELYQESVS